MPKSKSSNKHVQFLHMNLYRGNVPAVAKHLCKRPNDAQRSYEWPDHLPMTTFMTVLSSKTCDETKIALMQLLTKYGASPCKILTMAALWDSFRVAEHLLHVPDIIQPHNNSPLKVFYVLLKHRDEEIVMLFLRDESFASQLKEDRRKYYFVDDYHNDLVV